MDKTKSRLAAFFDNDDEESSLPQRTVDTQKLSQYTQGTARKSRREKEKEAAEAKKKEEEEHAARTYAEFLETFEGDDVGTKGAFVKGSGDAAAPYAPSMRSAYGSSSKLGKAGRMPSPPPMAAPKPKGKRAMDAFLEEIKQEQAMREAKYSRHAQGRSVTALAAYEGQSGSKDWGDPETSNIFVANLPPHVTEQSLGTFFARVGPVGSVKIMWPRADATIGPGSDMTAFRRSKSAGLSGFVSFMRRKDAEDALRQFDGFDWGGSILRVGWSKAVPMASKPKYSVPRSRSRDRPRSRSRSRSYERRRSRSRSRTRSRSRGRSRSPTRYSRRSYRSRSPRRRRSRSGHGRGRREDEEELVTDTFIRAVAAEVKGHGTQYEAKLRELEQGNAKYAFFLQKNHRRHAYFRGLVEHEDSLEPEFDDEGYNSVYSTDSAEESERERSKKTHLGRLARKRFEAMLRAMSGKAGEIARCMAFSLDHAEAAAEIADVIVASLLVDSTPVPRKVARLHLICDILHNSAASVPSAWKFRQEFQSRLGIVFDHLASIYHSFPGRITADVFKKQIISVLEVWEDWIVFPPDFTSHLRLRLEGATATQADPQREEHMDQREDAALAFASRFKTSSFKPGPDPVAAGSGVKTGSLDNGERTNEGTDGGHMDDVDGEPLDDSVDGEPIDDGIDGAPIEDDVDGVPMDDIDGAPMDGVDGVPIGDQASEFDTIERKSD